VFRSVLAVGGQSMGDQTAALVAGVDVVTCTPGRIRALIDDRGGGEPLVSLDQVRFLVRIFFSNYKFIVCICIINLKKKYCEL
jgi:superfamily II DNA/RNA helicase